MTIFLTKIIFLTWILPCLFYLCDFIFSEFCYIFFKNWQSYTETFSAYMKIFTIVSDIFKDVLNQFSKWKSKHWEKKDICKKRYSQNFMINIRKYCKKSNIYNSLKKHIFKQLKKAINQTLNISFQNTLEDTAFLY